MTVFAVTMVKDEADIIAATVGNMLNHVDHVMVADNGSTDATRSILEGLRDGRLTIIDDPDPAYRQSEKMTRLAHQAGRQGADWVVPFDADEWWAPTAGDYRLSEVLAKIPADFDAVAAVLYDHVPTGEDPDGDPCQTMGWRRQAPVPLPKVACRYHESLTIDQGNHSVTYQTGRRPPRMFGGAVHVHHFPYRSTEQFVRKVRNGAAAYNADPTIRADFGAHWRQWGRILDEQGPEAVAGIFRTWYWRNNPQIPVKVGGEWQPALIWDPV